MTHHLCIHDNYTVFDGRLVPVGKKDIEEKLTEATGEILDVVVPGIGKEKVVVCGEGDARVILGRKLEDRIKREVTYK